MISRLKNIFTSQTKARVVQPPAIGRALAQIPSYPPFQRGFPVAPIDALMNSQSDLISRIRIMLGLGDRFDELVLPVIERYASYVHLLPASEAHHHRAYGGLFRHGLEVGFWSAQFSLGVVFPFEGAPRYKRAHESRWMLAAFLAGLGHDLGKPVNDMRITKEAPRDPFSFESEGRDEVWSPYKEGVFDWAKRHGIQKYYLYWKPDRAHKAHERLTNIAFLQIVGLEVMDFISEYDDSCVPEVYATISSLSAAGMLTKLVMRADQASVTKDLQENRLDMDQYAYGIPIERYLFDAIRSLIGSGRWLVNNTSEKCFVYVTNQGVFIAWKEANYTLCEELNRLDIKGIPRSPDVLADILIDRGYALANEVISETGKTLNYRYWPLVRKVEKDGLTAQTKVFALRIESPGFIFADSTAPISDIAWLEQEAGATKVNCSVGMKNAFPNPSVDRLSHDIESGSEEAFGEEKNNLPLTLPEVMDQLMLTNPAVKPLEFVSGTLDTQADDSPSNENSPNFDSDKGLTVQSDKSLATDANSAEKLSHQVEDSCVNDFDANATINEDLENERFMCTEAFSIQGASSLNDGAFVMSGQSMDEVINAALTLTDGTDTFASQKEERAKESQSNNDPDSKAVQIIKANGDKFISKKATKKSGAKKDTSACVASTSINSAQAKVADKTSVMSDELLFLAINELLSGYGRPGNYVLELWSELIEGKAALGAKIDFREGFYCVCERAFENPEQYKEWVRLASKAGLVNECRSIADNWHEQAAKLNDAVQGLMLEIIKRIEEKTDPLINRAVSSQGLTSSGKKTRGSRHKSGPINPKKDKSLKPLAKLKGKGKGKSVAHKHLREEASQKTQTKSAMKASSLDEVCANFVGMISSGDGAWLSDWQEHEDGTCSVDGNTSFSRIVQSYDKSFTAIQLKIFFRKYQNPDVQYKAGRVFVKKAL